MQIETEICMALGIASSWFTESPSGGVFSIVVCRVFNCGVHFYLLLFYNVGKVYEFQVHTRQWGANRQWGARVGTLYNYSHGNIPPNSPVLGVTIVNSGTQVQCRLFFSSPIDSISMITSP